jgi:hypothetical protein
MHKDVIRDTAILADLDFLPVFSFVVFFVFFLGLLLYVVRQDKASMSHMAAMPLGEASTPLSATSAHGPTQ